MTARKPNTVVVMGATAPHSALKAVQEAAHFAQAPVWFATEASQDAKGSTLKLVGVDDVLILEHKTFVVGTGTATDRYPIRTPLVFLTLVSVLD